MSSTSSSAAAPGTARVVQRYFIVPSGEAALSSGQATVVGRKRARHDLGDAHDLTSSLLTGQRLYSYFPSPECTSAPTSMHVKLPDDLFAVQPADADEDDDGAPGQAGGDSSPRERLAVLTGTGTSGTAKSLQWALRKLQARTTFTAESSHDNSTPDAQPLELHAKPIWEYKELSCLLLKVPVTSDTGADPHRSQLHTAAHVAPTSLVDGPLVGLYCDRVAPAAASVGSDRGISSKWEHSAVKIKKGDWKNMDAVLKDEAEDRGRLQMVLDDEEPTNVPPLKRAKVGTTTPASGSVKRSVKSSTTPLEAPRQTKTAPSPPPPPPPPPERPAHPPPKPTPAATSTVPAPALVSAPSDTAPDAASTAPPATSSHAQLSAVAETVLMELRQQGKQTLSFKEWQKLVLKRLPEYRDISAHMKSPETRHVATRWFEDMREQLRTWLTVEKGFLMDPQGNVVA